jgi:hypothetical protein
MGVPAPNSPLEQAANTGVGTFNVFDIANGEPNTILKSWWPFMRRVTPWADYRDFIGCGLTEWRALYMSAIGTSGNFFHDQEALGRLQELPAGSWPVCEKGGALDGNLPARYLILTKGEPHREQIGRFAERINALEAMRLFSLKNLNLIKNAGLHLRLLGQQLDGILQVWGEQRQAIENQYTALIQKAQITTQDQQREEDNNEPLVGLFPTLYDRYPKLREAANKAGKRILTAAEWLKYFDDFNVKVIKLIHDTKRNHILTPQEIDIQQSRVEHLGNLIRTVEQDLIELSAALDNIGKGGAGRMLYLINRSVYFCDEFERLWPTLEIGNIDGWINYGQFVERGLKPTFNMIRNTGDRLVSLRERLQDLTETIQTSALIIETEATRSNTAQLSRILTSLYWVELPLILIGGGMFFKFVDKLFEANKNVPLSEAHRTAIYLAAICIYASFRYIRSRK